MPLFSSFRATRIACYLGYIVQAVSINFAPLLFVTFCNDFNIDLSRIAALVGINFAVQLTIDSLSTKFLSRINLRCAALFADAAVMLGLIGLGIFPQIFPTPYAGLLAAVLLCGVGGGLTEVLISPLIEACPAPAHGSSMSLLHSFYCWGQAGVIALSVLFFATVGIEKWELLACILALIPFADFLLFTFVPLPPTNSGEEGGKLTGFFKNRNFRLMLLMIAAAGAGEMVMSQWASGFAQAGLAVDKTVGDILGPCLFALLMGTARLLYAKFSDKVRLLPLIVLSALLCIGSYLLAALSPLPLLSLLGCGLCGLSVGILWPGIYTVAAKLMPQGGLPMFSLLALAGDIGCFIGPTVAGLVADAAGGNIGFAFLLATAIPLLLLYAALTLSRLTRNNRPKGL